MDSMNKENFTTDELLLMLAESLDNPLNSEIDAKAEAQIFHQLSKVDGLHTYLKNVLGKDILLYFQATSEEDRKVIRGAYQRMAHWKALMTKHSNLQ